MYVVIRRIICDRLGEFLVLEVISQISFMICYCCIAISIYLSIYLESLNKIFHSDLEISALVQFGTERPTKLVYFYTDKH